MGILEQEDCASFLPSPPCLFLFLKIPFNLIMNKAVWIIPFSYSRNKLYVFSKVIMILAIIMNLRIFFGLKSESMFALSIILVYLFCYTYYRRHKQSILSLKQNLLWIDYWVYQNLAIFK